MDGLACWDLDENGNPDLSTEDINGDGVVDVYDCQPSPLCPVGYVHDASETQFTLCYDPDSALGADEMVQVGDFWVDRYEASAWEFDDCSGDQYGETTIDDYPADLPNTGNWETATPPVYACSVPGVTPSRMLTWFQAQQSCAASGKDLCSNEQWQAAAAGTSDPGSNDGIGGGACHTSGSGPRLTGNAGGTPTASTSCMSAWGAEDMVGNLCEWVGDWYVAGQDWQAGDGQGTSPWPSGYEDDRTWNLDGRAYDGSAYIDGLPAAGLRGGHWGSGTGAGVFALSLSNGPSFWNASVGGDWLVYGIAWPGCLLAAIALVLGTWRYLAAAWRNASLRVSLLMVTGFGFGFPLWCYLASIVFSRSRFGWRYVAGAAGPVLVLAAIGLARRGITTRVLGVLLVATMTTVMLVNVFAGGREDYARLVSYVLENAREGDAVLQEPLWELDPSRGETPWRYYLERTNLPANAPVPDELVYSQHDDALRYERVWMWARDPYSPWVQESLQRHFPDESTWRMGPGLTLYLFSGPPKDE